MISILRHGARSSELFARKLSALRTRVDIDLIDGLALDAEGPTYPAGEVIFSPGATPGAEALLVSGVAAEVRRLGDGRRQILALRLPGDGLACQPADNVVALTPVRLAPSDGLRVALADPSPQYHDLRRGWIAAERADQALLRTQLVRLGRMSALERTAHLLLEIHERLARVGLATEHAFHLPLTQEMVSDVIGLSIVHLNRTLQALRRDGLVGLRQSYVTLTGHERLAELAAYLSPFPAPRSPGPAARETTRRLAAADGRSTREGVSPALAGAGRRAGVSAVGAPAARQGW